MPHNWSMSELTPSEFDRARRQEASREGRPLERTLAPGYVPVTDGRVLFAQYNGRLLSIVDSTDRDSQFNAAPSDIPALIGLDDEHPTTVVFPDRSHTARLQAALRHQQSFEAYAASAVLDVALAMPASSLVVVLSDALARKYWLPTDLTADFEGWCRAFGLNPVRGRFDTMNELLARAGVGRHWVFASTALGCVTSEHRMLSSARYGSMKAQISTYSTMNRIADDQKMLTELDPLLLERNLLTGDVAALELDRPLLPEEKGAVAMGAFSHGFRFKETSLLHAFTVEGDTPLHPLKAEVGEVIARGEDLAGSVVIERVPRGLWPVLSQTTGSLYLIERPYRPHPKKKKPGGRWMTREAAERSPHPGVPTDIALAGAPGTEKE